jgi:hypothetical protein
MVRPFGVGDQHAGGDRLDQGPGRARGRVRGRSARGRRSPRRDRGRSVAADRRRSLRRWSRFRRTADAARARGACRRRRRSGRTGAARPRGRPGRRRPLSAASGEAEAVGLDHVGGDHGPTGRTALAPVRGRVEQIEGRCRSCPGSGRWRRAPAGGRPSTTQAVGDVDIVEQALGQELQDRRRPGRRCRGRPSCRCPRRSRRPRGLALPPWTGVAEAQTAGSSAASWPGSADRAGSRARRGPCVALADDALRPRPGSRLRGWRRRPAGPRRRWW